MIACATDVPGLIKPCPIALAVFLIIRVSGGKVLGTFSSGHPSVRSSLYFFYICIEIGISSRRGGVVTPVQGGQAKVLTVTLFLA